MRGENVFQMDELIDSYRVASSTELNNPNFHVTENIYVDVNELNIMLSTSGHRKEGEDYEIDQLEFNEDDDENYKKDYD
jgi:hypothetical protein